MLKLIVAALVVALAVPAVLIGLPVATYDATIPSSCQQPGDVDYSTVGPADYGPYVVKITSRIHATPALTPWTTSARAVVGHGLTEDGTGDYGVWLDVESTDIDAYECVWTAEGVTIVEPGRTSTGPDGQSLTIGGLEHTVPATRFLGGR